MKILHLNTFAQGGAANAAFRLHKALLNDGVNSTLMTINSSDEATPSSVSVMKDLNGFMQKLNRKWSHWKNTRNTNWPTGADISNDNDNMLSLPYADFDILTSSQYKAADIIHLHWVAGMIDYRYFFKLNSKPIVWTLHDRNPIQGLKHFSESISAGSGDLNKLDLIVKEFKREAVLGGLIKPCIVAPSQWLLNQANLHFKESLPTRQIPNLAEFPKVSIEQSGKYQQPTFLYVSSLVDQTIKGFKFIDLEFLGKLGFSLRVVGKWVEPVENSNLHYLGSLSSKQLENELQCCHALLLPSLEDNLPNVMLEAFVAGLPVIGFPTGGISEHVIDEFNGILAKEHSTEALNAAILRWIKLFGAWDRNLIRDYARSKFSAQVVVNQYVKLYNSILMQ